MKVYYHNGLWFVVQFIYGPLSPSDNILSMTMAFCYFQLAIQKRSCDLFNTLVSLKVRVVNITTKVPHVSTLFLGKKSSVMGTVFSWQHVAWNSVVWLRVPWIKQGQKWAHCFSVPTIIYFKPKLESASGAPAYVYTWIGPCDIINFGHLI